MIIRTPEDMMRAGEELAKKHKKIFLSGALWAWKTHFTKWFAQGLWIDHTRVTSPTYAYINTYDDKLAHIDLYRVEEWDDFVQLQLLEQIDNHEYVVIERPKREEEYGDGFVHIMIEDHEEGRKLVFL